MKIISRITRQNRSGWMDYMPDKLQSDSQTDQSQLYDFVDYNSERIHESRPPVQGYLSSPNTPSLLSLFTPLPPFSSVLGICDDGLPLVMDLTDPSPGAILITGPHRSGKTQLIKSILLATSEINSVEELIFYIISPQPDEYREMYNLAHCMGLYSAYDRAASELIVDLAALAEQRRSGRHLGSKTIVVIDDLEEFLKTEEFEVINYMSWLLKHGARNGVWLIAAVSSDRIDKLDINLLAGYRTRVESGIAIPKLPDQTANRNGIPLDLGYRTMIGNQWVYFWLPSS